MILKHDETEAFTKLDEYKTLSAAIGSVPILANMTEFGKTPLYHTKDLGANGVAMVLYPLSAHRAMAKAAISVFETILRDGK